MRGLSSSTSIGRFLRPSFFLQSVLVQQAPVISDALDLLPTNPPRHKMMRAFLVAVAAIAIVHQSSAIQGYRMAQFDVGSDQFGQLRVHARRTGSTIGTKVEGLGEGLSRRVRRCL